MKNRRKSVNEQIQILVTSIEKYGDYDGSKKRKISVLSEIER